VVTGFITDAIIEIHASFYQFLALVKPRIGHSTTITIVKHLPALSARLRPLSIITDCKHITFLDFGGPINGRSTP
jgi:hypothetical protein